MYVCVKENQIKQIVKKKTSQVYNFAITLMYFKKLFQQFARLLKRDDYTCKSLEAIGVFLNPATRTYGHEHTH